MIQFTIHTATQGKLKLTAPYSWRELSLKQLIEIENEDLQVLGLSKLFAIICGIDHMEIAASTDRSIFEHMNTVCKFIADPPDWERIPFPKHLEIGAIVYKAPTQVSRLMHGQIELLTEMGRESNLLQVMSRAIAVIMQPEIDGGKFDDKRVDQIEKQVLDSSGLEAYGFASFFFLKLAPFLTTGIKNSKQFLKQSTRTPRYYSDWLKEIDSADIAV